ncbi:hypothetical protein IF803_25980 [Bradyrhizobium sp. UFLA06-06]
MAGRGYTIFDTAIGRCGIAWGELGVAGVQLPELREIETRKRLFKLYPDAREMRPPVEVAVAIEGAQPTTNKTLFDVLLPVARLRPQA